MRVRLRELRGDELPQWLEAARRFYVNDLERHAGMTTAEAEEKAGRDHEALFPDGRPKESQHLFAIEDERGEAIGRLFFETRPSGVWLYEIELEERVRGSGLGREAMLAFEEHARELGAAKVTLNVFGGNDIARSLYRSLGYVEEAVHMGKRLV
ncbi:MAG: GNAT family N-acetyltransferase [Actinobacteria bacterium]|nr:GNAT family N-acetyltransferase [Actinomycetota bacterium]